MQWLSDLLEKMRPHWNTLALAFTWIGIAFVYFRRRWDWQRKQFLNQVNFSLNYLIDGAPAMRTLREMSAQEVWLNEYGVKKVFAAAMKTTVEDPFIRLADPADQDFINRAALNVLGEHFADTFLAEALDVPVKLGTFCFGITCEKYGEIRTLKIRVLIIEEQLLNRLFGPDGEAEKLKISQQIYRARLKTLKAMYDVYLKDKGSSTPVLGHLQMGIHGEPHK